MSSLFIFFFKQKTAYEMRISDWSSDVCSSDLGDAVFELPHAHDVLLVVGAGGDDLRGRPAEHLLDGGGNGPHHRRFRVGHDRLEGQHLAQGIVEALAILLQTVEQIEDRKSTRMTSRQYCASRMRTSA